MRLSVLADPPYEVDANEMIVERYARSLERDIRESPADWLWLQNKWKVAKPAAGAEARERDARQALFGYDPRHTATVASSSAATPAANNRQCSGV